jgi:long-chain acyl-CoA synthetase
MRLLAAKLLDSAAKWPDACALKQGGTELTYAALVRRAAAIAGWLRSAGIGPGDRVALLSEASGDYVAAYYGTIMAGGVAVALNAAARAHDIVGWIAHSGASALFLDGLHPEAREVAKQMQPGVRILASNGAPLECRYEDVQSLPSCDSDVGLANAREHELAALIYTSGTTGRPKAVMLSHGNLAANVDSILDYLHLSFADSIVCVLPFYYSYGNSVLHTHLACGARIVVGPSLVYPHLVLDAIAREAASGFAGVPSTFALLAARVPFDRYDLGSLRYVTQAGGAMAPALTKRVQALMPQAKLFVMYGQTEASARLTYLPPDRLADKLGSVGIPIAGVQIDIRDDDGGALPRGVNGEVWARGANVMLGYWNDPESTTRVLVDGYLRTGDVGRLDDEGFLFLEGRRSDIIKVGAHRVFAGDVESVIEEIPGVDQVVAVGMDDELLGQVVKVYIVLSTGALLQESAVKGHCRARLASYKIPKVVEFLEALPRTSSGKIQRHLLTQASGQLAHEQTNPHS